MRSVFGPVTPSVPIAKLTNLRQRKIVSEDRFNPNVAPSAALASPATVRSVVALVSKDRGALSSNPPHWERARFWRHHGCPHHAVALDLESNVLGRAEHSAEVPNPDLSTGVIGDDRFTSVPAVFCAQRAAVPVGMANGPNRRKAVRQTAVCISQLENSCRRAERKQRWLDCLDYFRDGRVAAAR
jgi:hypothetical protein